MLNKCNGVKGTYIWGSLGKNFNNDNYRVRDIDLVIKTAFHSGDLLAIDKDILDQGIRSDKLEEDGFNIDAITLSKKIIYTDCPFLDKWVISSDNKLLHWGCFIQDMNESENMQQDANNHAKEKTGFGRDKITKVNNKVRENWYREYNNYIKRQTPDIPEGWYLSDIEKADLIINEKTCLPL